MRRLLSLLLAQETIALAAPLVAGLVVATIIDRDWSGFLTGALVLVALPFLQGLMFWRWEWAQALTAEGDAVARRRRLLAHVLRLPVTWFAVQKSGTLVTRATNDLRFLADHQRVQLEALRGGFVVVISTGVLATQHPLLAVTMVASTVPHALDLWLSRRHSDAISSASVDSTDAVNEYFRERLDIMPLTRASGAAHWEIAECTRVIHDRVLQADLRRAAFDARASARSALVQGLGLITLLLCSGWLIATTLIGVSGFVMAYGYAARLTSAVNDFSAWRRQEGEARDRTARLAALLAEPAEASHGIEPPEQIDELHLCDITFAYQSGVPVLDRLNLRLRRGELVAVVGPSGGGKSTLADLVTGLLSPDRGSIVINGDRSVTTLAGELWRRRVAYAPQFPYFFTDTLTANLSYGLHRETEPHEIPELAGRLGVTDLVRRAERRDDASLERTSMSGGQRQRLGLIRTGLRRAPVIAVFDEPTSALDALTEEHALSLIAELRHEAPVLLVAHRLTTLRYADRVVVLEHGRIVEEGTPSALAARKGRFAALYDKELRP